MFIPTSSYAGIFFILLGNMIAALEPSPRQIFKGKGIPQRIINKGEEFWKDVKMITKIPMSIIIP